MPSSSASSSSDSNVDLNPRLIDRLMACGGSVTTNQVRRIAKLSMYFSGCAASNSLPITLNFL